jgi:hypothetical protein
LAVSAVDLNSGANSGDLLVAEWRGNGQSGNTAGQPKDLALLCGLGLGADEFNRIVRAATLELSRRA